MSGYSSNQVDAEIDTIKSRLAGVLEGDWRSVLDQAKQQASPHSRDRATWVFEIGTKAPLRFRETDEKETGIKVRVDISGVFRAPGNGRPFFGHSVVIRVWAAGIDDCYNKELDAPELAQKCIARGRVISRFLFDTVKSPREPWCHLHFGGADREGHEYCRVPELLEVPRFVHYPVGLIQACEFVLFHFYPKAYADISRDPTWRIWLHASQVAYTRAYFDDIASLTRKWPNQQSYLQRCCVAK